MATEVMKRLINVDEYYKMAEVGILKPGDRVELINGEIYQMSRGAASPIGSKHGSVVKSLARILNEIFKGDAVIGIQDPVRLDENNEPEPDISILKYRADDYSQAHPGSQDVLAIIEVADSSLHHDKQVKMPLYANYGIPEYWIIDIATRQITVHLDPVGNSYSSQQVYGIGDEIVLLGKTIVVSDLLKF
ncbi:MAG: Uma2 family endonuclease [Imperialibacter sp.]|uniref:Uma2 family endonuclease n=1 Tax=Imperialibacter sp. TaxID=2038411 RepID=UPI0032EE0268